MDYSKTAYTEELLRPWPPYRKNNFVTKYASEIDFLYITDNHRLHKSEVIQLIKHLQQWIEKGTLALELEKP